MGKTALGDILASSVKKHPHVRGEDSSPMPFGRVIEETPPRAWGRLFAPAKPHRDSGNTPTCVGKTHERERGVIIMEKHPHVRGEDPLPQWRLVALWETPPRAWGRRIPLKRNNNGKRNTPTCVGKTRWVMIRPQLSKKHPHVRGEDLPDGSVRKVNVETPPRAWGRRPSTVHRGAYLRNTPTCVGKTCTCRASKPCTQKHPHVRGEDLA